MNDIREKFGKLIKTLMENHPAIRYVALLKGTQLMMQSKPELKNGSAEESDRYEELLVNPTLLTLAGRRGQIDCGGMDYVIVRYGNFYQWITPTSDGHVSVALDLTMNQKEMEPIIQQFTSRVQHD